MKKTTFILIAALMLTVAVAGIYAKASDNNDKKPSVIEANVWTTADGAKHFKCPVMGSEGIVSDKTTFSDIDGKRYYHCCGGCSAKLKADPDKYLKDFSVPGNVIKTDKEGQHFTCPVSGKTKIVSDNTLFSVKDGKQYYFCCENCKKKFDAEPENFLKSGKKAS